MEYKMTTVGVDQSGQGVVCTQLSCQDPQVIQNSIEIKSNLKFYLKSNLVGCLKNGDITTFSAILAEVAPEDDDAYKSLPDDEKQVWTQVA